MSFHEDTSEVKSTLRVLILPDWSKFNPYQRLLAEGLRERGIEVVLDGQRALTPISAAIHRHGRPGLVHLHWQHPYLLERNLFWSLIRSFLFLADFLVLKLSGVHIVWTVHNLLSHEPRYPRLELLFSSLVARLCDVLIVHYPEAVKAVQEVYRLRRGVDIQVVPHGHYRDVYPNQSTRDDARARLGLPEDGIAFLFFGAIRPYKNVRLLVESFAKLEGQDALLLLAGSPSEDIREELDALVAEVPRVRARFGFIPVGEVQFYLNASDAVVIPATDILTSGSAILAMSFGRALIAASTPHLRYLIGEHGGILYEADDDDGLIRALELAMRADLSSMGEYNLKRILRHSWEDVAEQTLNLYHQVLGTRSRIRRARSNLPEMTSCSDHVSSRQDQ